MWFIAGGRGGRGGRGFRGFRGDKNNTEYLVNPTHNRRRRVWRRRRSWLVGVALDSVCYDSYLLCLCLCLWRWWGGLNTGNNVGDFEKYSKKIINILIIHTWIYKIFIMSTHFLYWIICLVCKTKRILDEQLISTRNLIRQDWGTLRGARSGENKTQQWIIKCFESCHLKYLPNHLQCRVG